MPITHLLAHIETYALEKYQHPVDVEDLKNDCVAFSGSPQKHPHDEKKILLIVDPFSTHTSYYEFRGEDITFAEEIGNLVTLEGETVTIVRVWVRKRAVGIHCIPFMVESA